MTRAAPGPTRAPRGSPIDVEHLPETVAEVRLRLERLEHRISLLASALTHAGIIDPAQIDLGEESADETPLA